MFAISPAPLRAGGHAARLPRNDIPNPMCIMLTTYAQHCCGTTAYENNNLTHCPHSAFFADWACSQAHLNLPSKGEHKSGPAMRRGRPTIVERPPPTPLPAWASSILHQDQILARRPELLWLRDLDRPGHLALLVHPRTHVGRALPRNDLVLLVGPGQRDALLLGLVDGGEEIRGQVAGRLQPAAAEHQELAAFLGDDPLLHQLVLGADRVVDRVLVGGQVAHSVGQGGLVALEPALLRRERIHPAGQRGDLGVLLRQRRLVLGLLLLRRGLEVLDSLLVGLDLSQEPGVALP